MLSKAVILLAAAAPAAGFLVASPMASHGLALRSAARVSLMPMRMGVADLVKEEIAKAEEMSKKHGKDSQQAKLAWSFVEELQASQAHSETVVKALDELCKGEPGADECALYEKKLNEVRVLTAEIGGSMSMAELKAENERLRKENANLKK